MSLWAIEVGWTSGGSGLVVTEVVIVPAGLPFEADNVALNTIYQRHSEFAWTTGRRWQLAAETETPA